MDSPQANCLNMVEMLGRMVTNLNVKKNLLLDTMCVLLQFKHFICTIFILDWNNEGGTIF